MLLLHVWGPAFGLPSIDADCLAAILYLHNALPTSAWRLIRSHPCDVGPSYTLPALNHDGVWTCGYRPIVDYLVSRSLCHDLDRHLSPLQRADTLSCGAFLAARATPLLDLSLYASATNWSAATRPAYSSLLPFPLTWTVPTLIRTEAVARVEHLGLADLDTDFDPNGGLHLSAAGRDALPGSLRRHLPLRAKAISVREEMTPEQAAAIRLFGLAEACLNVLDELLSDAGEEKAQVEEGEDGERKARTGLRFFPGTAVSSLDCLAFAHLALMLNPPVPRSFLRDCLESRTPRLRSFVDDMMATCLVARGDLPWATPPAVSLLRFSARVLDSTLRHIPGLGDLYVTEMRLRAEQGRSGLDGGTLVFLVGFLVAGVAAGYGALRYRAMQPFGALVQTWESRHRSKLGEFGELGSMLSSVLGPLSTASSSNTSNVGGRLVELDSEVD